MIRALINDDKSQIDELYQQLYSKYNSVNLSKDNFSSEFIPLVYEEKEKILGLIIGIVIKFGRLKEAYIEDLVVDKNSRSIGIGTKLITRIEEEFKNRSVEVIFLATDYENEEDSPVQFYEKLGYHQSKTPWMIKKLI